MVSSLRECVTRYIDHLQDAPWVESFVGDYGLEEVLQSCVDVLTGGNPDEVHEVTTFLRDIGIRGIVDDELVANARELMPNSVLPALRSLLAVPVLQVRMAAIYTIGKLSFPSEARALRGAFPSYLDRDPFCVARLLSELRWLGDRRGVQARLKQVVAHKCYLVRWCALGYLDCWGTPSGTELHLKSQWLRALSSDSAPFVSAEARHQVAELELEVAGRKAKWLPKPEWRRRRRALEKAEPSITFSILETQFLNEMARREQADYTLGELDEFVRARAQPAPS